jgi:hypothetical protein
VEAAVSEPWSNGPLHAVQVCPVSREAFLEFIPIGEIEEFLFDSRDPSRNVEPIQTMLAFLPKPGAYHTSQSIFAIRQDPQIGVLSSTTAPENGLHPPLCIRIQVPHHGECLAAALRTQSDQRHRSLAGDQAQREKIVEFKDGAMARRVIKRIKADAQS